MPSTFHHEVIVRIFILFHKFLKALYLGLFSNSLSVSCQSASLEVVMMSGWSFNEELFILFSTSIRFQRVASILLVVQLHSAMFL